MNTPETMTNQDETREILEARLVGAEKSVNVYQEILLIRQIIDTYLKLLWKSLQ